MQPPPLDEPWRRVVYIHRVAESSTLAIHAAQQTASVRCSRYALGTFTVSLSAGDP